MVTPRHLLVVSLLMAGCASAPRPGAGDSLLDITGRWRSEAPEPFAAAGGDTNYLQREFEFADGRWRIRFGVFDDAALSVPLFKGENSGEYRLTGGDQAEFFFTERTLTPMTAALATALDKAGCGAEGWQPGLARSVAEQGCAAFRVSSRKDCDREYDRVRLEDSRLYLGARPADGNLCAPDRRPRTFGAALVKVPR